jgi:hypothetical protein
MANTTITALPNASTPLTGTERVPMDQAGVTVDASAQQIADLKDADPSGAAAAAVAAHEAAADPHPTYLTEAEGNLLYAPLNWPGATDLSYNAGSRLLSSSTGADVTLPLFTPTDAGLAPSSGGGTSNFLRADGTWAAPPGGSGSTDLSYTASTRLLESSSGADVTLPLADGTNAGLMASADKTKLDGVAASATANSSDATLLDRSNHTGTQAAGTVTGLADVATSGAYGDLSDTPILGTAAATDLSDTEPAALGVAAAGVAAAASRSDHVHAMPSVLTSDGEALARVSEGAPGALVAAASIAVGRAPSIQEVTATEATTFTFTLEVGDTVTLGVAGDFTLIWAGAAAETIKWTAPTPVAGTAPDPASTGQLWVQFTKVGASMIHASKLYYVV